MTNLVDSILTQSYVQLKPSKVCDGVGVFALRTIPKNTILFTDVEPDSNLITWESLKQADQQVLEYLKSICNTSDQGVYLNRTINNINVTYYVNHSDNPNVIHNKILDVYMTLTDIHPGQELVCKYEPEEIDWI
jgi:SET domain-containing protein